MDNEIKDTVNNSLKLPDNCNLLCDFNGYVLAQHDYKVGDKQRSEYITWQKGQNDGVVLGHYYNDVQSAKEDFAKRSELVPENKMFNKDELAVLYKALSVYENGEYVDFDNKELCKHIENVRDKLDSIEDIDIEKYIRITVIVVEQNKEPYEKQIKNDLYSFQDAVEGCIEVIHPFNDSAIIRCNEMGKINNLPFNRVVNDDVIVGTFIITGMREDTFASLSKEQIKKYKEKFKDTMDKNIFKKSVDMALTSNKNKSIKPIDIHR